MNETITLPTPVINVGAPVASKWARDHAAFGRLLPQLLATHQGMYVAIHGEQVVDTGDDKLALALRVLGKIGNIDIHIGLVTEQPAPTAHSGVRREIRSGGGHS